VTKKIGILGGGQLGRMFLQAAYNYPFVYHVMDKAKAPCSQLCEHFYEGDFQDYHAIMDFAMPLDIIGIEIEHVNTDALQALEDNGKTVIPSPKALAIIKDKGLQKQFYSQHAIKTPEYYLVADKGEIDIQRFGFPFVQKQRTGGYDGKGVQIIRDTSDLHRLWNIASVIERFTPIAKEIAVLVALDQQGHMRTYPSVEMVFDADLNLLDYLFSPADISVAQAQCADRLARQVAKSFACPGLFAVELFIDQQGELWVNEVAPRVHNSGHHTIEAAYTSQFEQMVRILSGLSLGKTGLHHAAAMINLLGAEHQGVAVVKGIDELSMLDKTYLHWYGKTTTSPGRKMGHVTLLGERQMLAQKIATIKSAVHVVSF